MKKVSNIKITLDENEIKQLIADYISDQGDAVPYNVSIESSQIKLHHIAGEFSAQLILENIEE